MSSSAFTLAVIGGASGVGKTTILDKIPDLPRVSTGTLFKSHMLLVSRDDVRKGDWSLHERAVCEDLIAELQRQCMPGNILLLDTHFSAKLNARNYRIGLQHALLLRLGRALQAISCEKSMSAVVRVVLIDCDPHDLLRRRRLDKERDRELIPSDCYNALRENRVCSHRYAAEFHRAITPPYKDLADVRALVTYHCVMNDNIKNASGQLAAFISGQ